MAQAKAESRYFGMTTGELVITAVGAGLGIYAVKSVIDKTGNLLGVNDSDNSEAGVKQKAFNPNYWKTVPQSAMLLGDEYAKQLAKDLHSYSGLFSDNFGTVMKVFKQLDSKAEVSQLADVFAGKYKYDMYTFLLDGGGILPWDGLSNSNLSKLNTYIKSLRDY